MDEKKVKVILKQAEHYLEQVKILEDGFSKGMKQVNDSASNTKKLVERHFSILQEAVNNILNERKQVLMDRIQKEWEEGCAPLYVSASNMREKIKSMEKFIKLGKTVLADPDDRDAIEEFIKLSEALDKKPLAKTTTTVAHFGFESDDDCLNNLKKYISQYGKITTLGPVQLWKFEEKPGGIYVEWRMADNDEQPVDVQEFILQKASGDGETYLPNFQNCYVGQDTHFLCKDVVVGDYYSFRVSCKFEGSNNHSCWSLPLAYRTTIKPYKWKESGHYSMNDEFKIAKPLIDAAPMLVSEGPQFRVGYTIEFTILEMDENIAHIGLMTTKKKQLSSSEDVSGTFIVDSDGTIKVDGITKTTFLPAFTKNCKICFSCECLNDTRVVIHIDIDDKRVTYEWMVPKSEPYFFAAELPTTKWKILVE